MIRTPHAQLRIDALLHESKAVGVLYHFSSVTGALGILTDMAMLAHGVDDASAKSVSLQYTHPIKTLGGVVLPNALRGTVMAVSLTNRPSPLRSVGGTWRFMLDGDRMSDVYKLIPYAALEYQSGTTFDEYETILLAKGSPSAIRIKSVWILELAIHYEIMHQFVEHPESFTFASTPAKVVRMAGQRGVPLRVFERSGRSRALTDAEQDAILSLESRARQKGARTLASMVVPM